MALMSLVKAGGVTGLGYAAFQGINALQNRKIIVDEANLYTFKSFTIIATAAAALYFIAEAYGNYNYPNENQSELRNREIINCFGSTAIVALFLALFLPAVAAIDASMHRKD